MTGPVGQREHEARERIVRFRVDLTDSNCGPGWNSVEIDFAMPVGWSTDRVRLLASNYYAVPLEQVGNVVIPSKAKP